VSHTLPPIRSYCTETLAVSLERHDRRQVNSLHQAPSHVATDVDIIMGVGFGHRIDVILEILDAEVVFQNLVLGLVVLALQTCAVLSHVDDRSAVAIRDPLHEFAEAKGVWTKPWRLCLGANWCAVLVLEEEFEVARKILGIGFGGDVLDVVGTVVVPDNVSPSMVTKVRDTQTYIP
jgi:hypothetical protein